MSEPQVPKRLLDDARVAMEQLRQQHVLAWQEADRLRAAQARLLDAAARALERCEVACDPSGAADEAAAILAQVVTLSGGYVSPSGEGDR